MPIPTPVLVPTHRARLVINTPDSPAFVGIVRGVLLSLSEAVSYEKSKNGVDVEAAAAAFEETVSVPFEIDQSPTPDLLPVATVDIRLTVPAGAAQVEQVREFLRKAARAECYYQSGAVSASAIAAQWAALENQELGVCEECGGE